MQTAMLAVLSNIFTNTSSSGFDPMNPKSHTTKASKYVDMIFVGSKLVRATSLPSFVMLTESVRKEAAEESCKITAWI